MKDLLYFVFFLLSFLELFSIQIYAQVILNATFF